MTINMVEIRIAMMPPPSSESSTTGRVSFTMTLHNKSVTREERERGKEIKPF
jgi:hypothetical protein